MCVLFWFFSPPLWPHYKAGAGGRASFRSDRPPARGCAPLAGMPLPAALLPALLLGLLWPGAVRGRPPPGRLPAGPRQRRWDAALFARSVARLPAERRDAARDGDYLLGIKRLRRLYCNVGIGFHIQVLPDGRIDGIHSENRYSKPAPTPAAGQVSRSAPAEPLLWRSCGRGAAHLTRRTVWVRGRVGLGQTSRRLEKSARAGCPEGVLRPGERDGGRAHRALHAATPRVAVPGAALSPRSQQASGVGAASTSGGSSGPWAAHLE